MYRSVGIMLGSLVLALLLVISLIGVRQGSGRGASDDPILLYCAVSNREVIDTICAEYQREFDRRVEVQYGPSQTLLSSIEVSRTGDLYLPADESFLQLGKEKSLIEETIAIASMRAVAAVHRDFKQSTLAFDDLIGGELRVVQASPDAAAIGKMTRQALQQRGLWQSLDQATSAYRTTISEVANDVLVGAADVGIVYDAVLHTYPDLRAIEIDELRPVQSDVVIGVLATSKQPAAALHFARYVSARDRGLVHYAQHGFRVGSGDQWSDVPELSLFVGSMLRPAVERTIIDFEQREGVRVTRVYNGCGILVAAMKGGQHPDAYFACDTEFMDQVVDLFPDPVPVSKNELVIAVQKGNPKQIHSLSDLARPGITLGIGHPQQCAMGWLTQNTFQESGLS
jgi:molybdate transport system substrate-binding protein